MICASCGADLPPSKTAVCQECGGRYCGAHILDHRCPDDWSCDHGGRWIRWPGGWMQVVAPMRIVRGEPQRICRCEPPFVGEKIAVGA